MTALKFLAPTTKDNRVYIDLETTGLEPFQGDVILGVALGMVNRRGNFKSVYYPFCHPDSKNLTKREQQQLFAHLMKLDKYVVWVGHNIRFDLHFLRLIKKDFAKRGNIWDTMVAAHISNERRIRFALKILGHQYFGDSATTEEDEVMSKIANKGLLYTLPAKDVAPYACKDVELTYKLDLEFRKELAEQALTDVATRQMKLVHIVEEMEARGLPLNVERTITFLAEANKKQKYYRKRLQKLTGNPDFNPASTPQLREFTGWESTKQDLVEERLAKGQVEPRLVSFLKALLNFRRWGKVAGSYYRVFLDRLDDNGRIHPNLNPIGTETGRFSCSKPNFQSLPRGRSDDDKIYKVRKVITPQEGNVLVFIDYKQAEMRIASHYAEEEEMMEILREGGDPHSWVAQEVFKSTKWYARYIAKRVNFGVVYGIGVKALSEMPDLRMIKGLDWNYAKAERFLSMYRSRFRGYNQLYRRAQNIAKQRGYIYLFTGRRRRYPDKNDDWQTRKASSNLVQGTVAEIVNEAIIRCDVILKKAKLKPGLVLQVHDELIFEIPRGTVYSVIDDMIEACEDWDFDVPMPVDVSVGIKSWGEKISLEKYIAEGYDDIDWLD